MLEVILPWPPSVNRAYRAYAQKTSRGVLHKVLISKEARDFKKTVKNLFLHKTSPFILSSNLSIELYLAPPNNRKLDIDNRVKICIDALQDAGVFADDYYINHLYVERCKCFPPKGRVFVRILDIHESSKRDCCRFIQWRNNIV